MSLLSWPLSPGREYGIARFGLKNLRPGLQTRYATWRSSCVALHPFLHDNDRQNTLSTFSVSIVSHNITYLDHLPPNSGRMLQGVAPLQLG